MDAVANYLESMDLSEFENQMQQILFDKSPVQLNNGEPSSFTAHLGVVSGNEVADTVVFQPLLKDSGDGLPNKPTPALGTQIRPKRASDCTPEFLMSEMLSKYSDVPAELQVSEISSNEIQSNSIASSATIADAFEKIFGDVSGVAGFDIEITDGLTNQRHDVSNGFFWPESFEDVQSPVNIIDLGAEIKVVGEDNVSSMDESHTIEDDEQTNVSSLEQESQLEETSRVLLGMSSKLADMPESERMEIEDRYPSLFPDPEESGSDFYPALGGEVEQSVEMKKSKPTRLKSTRQKTERRPPRQAVRISEKVQRQTSVPAGSKSARHYPTKVQQQLLKIAEQKAMGTTNAKVIEKVAKADGSPIIVAQPDSSGVLNSGGFIGYFSEEKYGEEFCPSYVVSISDSVLDESLEMFPSISRPSFAPSGSDNVFDGFFICGTEEQRAEKKQYNKLIACKLLYDDDKNVTTTIPWTCGLDDHCRDIKWLNKRQVAFASGNNIGLIKLTDEAVLSDSTMLPPMHKKVVRELAVSPKNENLLVSGGMDGVVLISDVNTICSSLENKEKTFKVHCFNCIDSVGSVKWNPCNDNLCSCTTDVGMLYVLDLRMQQQTLSESQSFSTRKQELYTHQYCQENIVFLGFGNGSVGIVDLRYQKGLMAFTDPSVHAIGDIEFGQGTMAVSGAPAVSIWSLQDTVFRYEGSHYAGGQVPITRVSGNAPEGAKCSSSFYTDSADASYLAVTDSIGSLSLYGLPL